MVWDYHVLAVGRTLAHETWVFDLDSELPFPCPLRDWVHKALLPGHELCQSPRLARRWRCVEASQFMDNFASDRSHMYKETCIEGSAQIQWSSPPPPYKCIQTAEKNTLPRYLDMSDPLPTAPTAISGCHGSPYGVPLDEENFLRLLESSE